MLENYIQNNYLRAVVIFAIFLIGLRILVSIVERVILRAVKKTKTDLDDILIEKSSKPITVLLMFICFKIAIYELRLSSGLLNNVNSFIYSGIVISIGWIIYVVLDVLVFEVWKKVNKRARINVAQSLASLIHGLLKVLLIIFILLYVLSIWGIEIGPLLTGLGIAGLAIALALQPILSNVFSGVAIILDKSVRIGDLVYLESGVQGKIAKIGLRSTKINTFDNELIIVPNNKLSDGTIQNIALPEPKTRAVVPFGVAYGNDIDKVKKIVLKEIKSIKNIEKEPEPSIKFLEMADSSLNFKAYFYVNSFENRFAAIDEANTKIYNTLNKHGIEIPFPQMDVNLKK